MAKKVLVKSNGSHVDVRSIETELLLDIISIIMQRSVIGMCVTFKNFRGQDETIEIYGAQALAMLDYDSYNNELLRRSEIAKSNGK